MPHFAGRLIRVGAWRLAAFAAVTAGAGSPAAGQPSLPTISGRVLDSASGVGVAGAEVTVRGMRFATGLSGAFRFFVPRGAGDTMRIRRLGYRSRTVVLAADSGMGMTVVIAALPQLLAPAVVEAVRPRYSGRLAGYHERLERRTTGQFITRAELEKDQQGLLSHVLQHAPGVQVRRGRGVPIVTLRGRNCQPLIWLDGVAMPADDVNIDSFSPSSLHGVELYAGSISAPQRYQRLRGRGDCGTILLWSRGPDTDPVGSGSGSDPEDLERHLAAAGAFSAEEVDVAATPQAGMIEVRFPPALRATGVTGSVIAEFVVDTTGAVDPWTFGIVTASHPAFAEAVRGALLAASFRPALRSGRPVRQLVRQRFAFGPSAR